MPPAAPQQSQGDNSLGILWIIVGLFALALGLWYFAHEQIAAFILKIRWYETLLISYFTDSVTKEMMMIYNASPATVTFNSLGDISSAVGSYFRYPFAIILGALAVIIAFTNPNLRYKKTYNMQRLVEQEMMNWPQISPVTGLDLVNANIDQGPWAMSLSPMQFAKKYQLLQLERVIPVEGFSAQGKIIATVKREEAFRAFALQVGRYWQGPEYLSMHAKALFAAFAARANRDSESAVKLLKQISASTKTGKLDFTGTEELLKKYKDTKAVVKVSQKHAFVLTVMASMLLLARTDGVQASADFLWLKPIDRPLWFMLNSVGRQTPHSEIAGPFAHWLAENRMGRKLHVPMVEEAVNALDEAIREIIIPEVSEEAASIKQADEG